MVLEAWRKANLWAVLENNRSPKVAYSYDRIDLVNRPGQHHIVREPSKRVVTRPSLYLNLGVGVAETSDVVFREKAGRTAAEKAEEGKVHTVIQWDRTSIYSERPFRNHIVGLSACLTCLPSARGHEHGPCLRLRR